MDTYKYYIVYYTTTGIFYGFYDDIEVAKSIISNNQELSYKEISTEVHSYIIEHLIDIKQPILDVSKINSLNGENDKKDIIDSVFVIVEQTPNKTPFSKIVESFVSLIKNKCGEFITNGSFIELSDGTTKEFSFKIEDQINLKELVDNNTEDSLIFYHANGEYDTEYSYQDIVTIYKTLYNNKIFNQIYSQVMCRWLNESFTEEMYESKEYIIEYGYSNDEILGKVESKYEQYRLL